MLDRKLPLNALRAFEAAGRRGSLTAAAAELQVSVAAVSRHVALLEGYLGYTMLQRTRTGVQFTERGRLYFTRITDAFEAIHSAGKQLNDGILDGRLTVSLYTTFTSEWFAPRLERFRAAYPDIDLRLKISTSEADFDCDRVDIALTGYPPDDPRCHYDPVFESVLLPICAPALADRMRFTAPGDLATQTLLYEGREALFWHRWFKAAGAPPANLERGLRFDCTSLAYQAARNGVGVALGQLFYVADDLASGRLVAPFPMTIGVPFTHRLSCHKARLKEPLIATFREWLLAEAARTNELGAGLGFPVNGAVPGAEPAASLAG